MTTASRAVSIPTDTPSTVLSSSPLTAPPSARTSSRHLSSSTSAPSIPPAPPAPTRRSRPASPDATCGTATTLTARARRRLPWRFARSWWATRALNAWELTEVLVRRAATWRGTPARRSSCTPSLERATTVSSSPRTTRGCLPTSMTSTSATVALTGSILATSGPRPKPPGRVSSRFRRRSTSSRSSPSTRTGRSAAVCCSRRPPATTSCRRTRQGSARRKWGSM
mmetsp:Transcript_29336/g.69681  ORF Transcript_29336/g.69681 Transcript_29336/m.69681 type:complete len:225 (-) Transcript_29336:742-1416(-)